MLLLGRWARLKGEVGFDRPGIEYKYETIGYVDSLDWIINESLWAKIHVTNTKQKRVLAAQRHN